jgi:DNA-binding Xre family transcriptional regulator
MCGILGYLGLRNGTPIVHEGLKALAYRGYDSWGIAIHTENGITIQKGVGDITNTSALQLPSMRVIGHTRWAKGNLNNHRSVSHQKITNMNILDIIPKENYYVQIDKNFQKLIDENIKIKYEIFSKLELSRKTLYRIRRKENYWCNLGNLLQLCKMLEIKKSELIRHIKNIKTKNSFPIRLKEIILDNALARTLGHILGDGGIHIIKKEKKYRAFYVNNEDTLLHVFKSDVQQIFGDSTVYFRRREEHGDEIWLSSTVGFLLYKFLEYDKFSEKRVPSLIKKSNNPEIICSFLQALYDDEGFLYPNKKMIVISLSNYNLLKDIRDLICRLGIRANQILIHKSKTRSKMYYFSITGRCNIAMFQEKINFIHPIKKEKLQLLLKTYRG